MLQHQHLPTSAFVAHLGNISTNPKSVFRTDAVTGSKIDWPSENALQTSSGLLFSFGTPTLPEALRSYQLYLYQPAAVASFRHYVEL